MRSEALSYLAVSRAVSGDYRTLVKLKTRFGSWERARTALWNGTEAVRGMADAEKELARSGSVLILADEAGFPPLLREIPEPPFGIYVRGTLPPAGALAIAIVGTRRATPDGKAIARRFARELAQAGCAVISGLAFGIDAAAHEGCLEAGGKTVAVLAGGLHRTYPEENAKLAEKILETGGALVSEYPPGIPPYPVRFIERNRLISGLAQGVLIVEAPHGSGSLATARFALEQNRDVFVVPGPITQKNFEGSHDLIRQGATLAASSLEILEAYGVGSEEKIAAQRNTLSAHETQVLKALQEIGAPAEVDKISTAAKLEPRIVNRAISFLITKELVEENERGYTIK